MALLSIATYFVGSWFAPLLGRMMDKLGTRKMLWLESGYILVSFTLMGVLAGMLSAGALATDGWQCWLVYAAYVLCILFEQFNMVHSFMMRAIALDPEEVTETLSVGLSVDHIMAISVSPIMGIIWARLGVSASGSEMSAPARYATAERYRVLSRSSSPSSSTSIRQ